MNSPEQCVEIKTLKVEMSREVFDHETVLDMTRTSSYNNKAS